MSGRSSEVFVDEIEETEADVSQDESTVLKEKAATSSAISVDLSHQTVGLLQRQPHAEDDAGKESGNEGVDLTKDIYSLLYTSELYSSPFFFAIFCLAFQYIFIILVVIDILDNAESNNPFKLPPGVPMQVTIGQGLALLLALAMQDDLLTGIIYIHHGHRCFFQGESLPGATATKWYLAAIAQLFAGAGLNFVIFILVMQSSDIIGMFLNFAALMFISEIDDSKSHSIYTCTGAVSPRISVGFKLADSGFVNTTLQKACKDVARVKMAFTGEDNAAYRKVLLVLMATSIYTGYGVLTYRQMNGSFLCNRVLLQFGDDFGTTFAAFSGVYVQTNGLINQRVSYVEENRKHSRGQIGSIGYCRKEQVWTLYVNGADDPCSWLARSSVTNTFDVTTTTSSNWLTRNEETEQTLEYTSFYLACTDCNLDLCHPNHGTCNGNVCVCDPGRYGVNCEFQNPCPVITLDFRTNSFPLLANGLVDPPTTYALLQNDNGVALSYGKPVYVSDESFFGHFYALLFTGRRYALIMYPEKSRTTNTSALADLLQSSSGPYHSFFDSPAALQRKNYTYWFAYLSDPMDVGTSSDALTPEGLGWFHSRDSFNAMAREGPVFGEGFVHVGTKLLCAVCDRTTNSCFNYHTCDESSHTCSCSRLYDGVLCEAPKDCVDVGCLEGGACDERSGTCACPTHTTGNFCEHGEDCSIAGCMDGGICNKNTGECECPKDGSGGFYCFWNGNCAISEFCLNGGTCASSGVCDCPWEFVGPFCQYRWDCSFIECQGGGVCDDDSQSCFCPSGRTGRICEQTAD